MSDRKVSAGKSGQTPVAVRGQSNSGEKQRKQKKPVQRKAKTGYDRKETNSDEFWGE